VLFGQAKVFDMTSTQALVDQNKQHYSDNTTAKTSSAAIAVQQTANTSLNNKVKAQCDSLDKQLTSVFTVIGDAQMLTDVLTAVDEITTYQSKAVKLLEQYPWLSPWYLSEQQKILNASTDTYKLIALIILSIGDINKIDNSQRRMIFYGVRDEENRLVQKNSDLVDLMNALIQAYKQLTSLPGQFQDNNKKIMQQIMSGYQL
jgi:hypothetical protein